MQMADADASDRRHTQHPTNFLDEDAIVLTINSLPSLSPSSPSLPLTLFFSCFGFWVPCIFCLRVPFCLCCDGEGEPLSLSHSQGHRDRVASFTRFECCAPSGSITPASFQFD